MANIEFTNQGAPENRALVFWFTGLSGAGKTTLASMLAGHLRQGGRPCALLDGDEMRRGLCSDLGFLEADRTENVRRIAECAATLRSQNINCCVSLISPLESQRRMARKIVGPAFREIYVDCPLEVCAARDVKGLYAKSRAGLVKNMTGLASPYEEPAMPELVLPTARLSLDECVKRLRAFAGS